MGIVYVALLALLRATAQQDNQRIAHYPEINPVTGAMIDLQFLQPAADAFDIGRIAALQTIQRDNDTGSSLSIEIVEPLREGTGAIDIKILFQLRHLKVTYTVL